MSKNILTSVIWSDETKTFGVIKPFYFSCCHLYFLYVLLFYSVCVKFFYAATSISCGFVSFDFILSASGRSGSNQLSAMYAFSVSPNMLLNPCPLIHQ